MATHLVRKQFYIQKRQDVLLKRLSKGRGISEAEIIRQAIEREFRGEPQQQIVGSSSLEPFIQLALEKRTLAVDTEPYRWDRDEIYAEREQRWPVDLRDK